MSKNMLLIKSEWQDIPSFRMIPIDANCPYVEVIYDPKSKTLAVIGINKKETPDHLPKLDSEGVAEWIKQAPRPKDPKVPYNERVTITGKKYKEVRVMLNTYQQYYITDKQDVIGFINLFAKNVDSFDFLHYLNLEIPSEPQANPADISNIIINEEGLGE